ncbi:hypothetical protein D5S18_19965 [Nocardia panacis]|uniref:Peptidase M14 domain-containing protein n=1 Tax=Nocardia panacis TaxID=2340916 RepID=A0A3A4K4X7_9NOCA|nr:M14 family zinc carboxypeptidase [Nocardia panacis]RJO73491.1 hypothetical protein D5S18_19965 [Nocardia panacis]
MSELDRAHRIAPLRAFPTVDQLHSALAEVARTHPDRVTITEIGRSRAGEPLRAVRVGGGARQIVVIGNPHPNEPIGMATIEHLVRALAAGADTLGATWHFVPCIDPDGTRLNEGWFAGPRTRTAVAAEFYRPPATEQPEWAFPVSWDGALVGTPLPETEALMTLIDRVRPALIASLHNADFGGGYFYTSGGDASYWSALTGLLTGADIPVHDGEPDAPGARRWARGVFEVPTFTTMAEALTAAGVEPVAALGGGGCRDYAAKYGAAVLVCELPLRLDARIADTSPSGRTLGEVCDEVAGRYYALAAEAALVLDRIADGLDGSSPFERAVRALVEALPGLAEVKEATPERDRAATRGEVFTERHCWLGMFRLRLGGMLVRLLDELVATGHVSARAERIRFGAIFEAWCAEEEEHAPGEAIPLELLVGIQAGAIATAARRSRDGLPI